ncbi:MAG: PAS domain S-box protein [Desulfobacteraceae bacterium]|jgi:PAS domain S-box-containing protein
MTEKQSKSITRAILYGFTAMMLFFIAYGLFSYDSKILLIIWCVISVVIIFITVKRAGLTERQLAREKEKYRLLSENTLDVIWTMNMNHEFTYVNPAVFQLTGYSVEEWVGSRLPDHCDEENYKKMEKIISDEIEKGPASKGVIFQAIILNKNRKPVPLEIRGRIIFDENKRPVGLQGSSRNISERKQAEEALRQSLEKYEKTFQAVPVWIVISSVEDGKFFEVNKTFLNAMGYSREELIGRTSLDINSWVDPQQRESIVDEIKEYGHVHEKDVRMRVHSGEIIDTLFSAETLILDGQQVMLSVTRDITEQKKAEKDRDKLQKQLLQAQKMESVGRLAGGVAHDFNNMLGVIMGYTEILLENHGPEDPFYDDLQEILDAAKRSTDITRQLLAFARKQTINPRVIDLNSTVESMLKMIRRLIGEDIDLAWFPCKGLLQVNIDPMQVDQVMANLCVNARDAIEGIGKLTIETDHTLIDNDYCKDHPEFLPGDYVVLSVSDDGTGMDTETMQNIFDPFYTTKGLGKGTGLGLSTVYGIVKQNEGMINVYSEKDKGTTFTIYLPLFAGDIADVHETVIKETPLSRGETVLIVEDDPAILKMGRRMLEQLKYKVVFASAPGDALGLVREYRDKIDLLITDVIMPEMNGRDLSSRVRLFYPDLKVLYMSGYTADVIAHRGVLDKGVCFVQKPFSKKDFAVKIREALEN